MPSPSKPPLQLEKPPTGAAKSSLQKSDSKPSVKQRHTDANAAATPPAGHHGSRPSTKAAAVTATMAIAKSSPSAHKRRRQRPKTSVAELQRMQRLRLLRLAHHGASVAAALLMQESTHPLHPAVVQQQQQQKLRPHTSFTPTLTRSAHDVGMTPSKPTLDPQQQRDQTRTGGPVKAAAAATTIPTPRNPSSRSAKESEASTAHGVRRLNIGVDEEDEDTGVSGVPDRQDVLAALTVEPSTYTDLWRHLLQLQFTTPHIGTTDATDLTDPLADSALLTNGQLKGLPQNADDTWNGTEQGNTVTHCNPLSFSSLADRLQSMDKDWRTLFLHHGRGSRDGGVASVVEARPGAEAFVWHATSPFLSRGEAYTLHRYYNTTVTPSSVSVLSEEVEKADVDLSSALFVCGR